MRSIAGFLTSVIFAVVALLGGTRSEGRLADHSAVEAAALSSSRAPVFEKSRDRIGGVSHLTRQSEKSSSGTSLFFVPTAEWNVSQFGVTSGLSFANANRLGTPLWHHGYHATAPPTSSKSLTPISIGMTLHS